MFKSSLRRSPAQVRANVQAARLCGGVVERLAREPDDLRRRFARNQNLFERVTAHAIHGLLAPDIRSLGVRELFLVCGCRESECTVWGKKQRTLVAKVVVKSHGV